MTMRQSHRFDRFTDCSNLIEFDQDSVGGLKIDAFLKKGAVSYKDIIAHDLTNMT
jgi:hypothetical protein